ncbi:MAG: surface-adhesin E family protein [Thermodesulfovibrionales bacterium]
MGIIDVLEVYAQNWRDFIPSDKTGGQILQFDPDSKKKVSDAIVRVWVKAENKEQKDAKKGATPISKTFYLTEINCTESMHRIISTSSYLQDGRIVQSTNEPDATWHYIVPESIASHLKKAVCDSK